jgi:hypothetical protein
LRPDLQTQMVISYLFSGRNLGIDENRRYLEFLESDAGQWFYRQTNAGLVNAMARAGRAFGSHSSAWIQDYQASQSADVSAPERKAAADEGRAFANENDQATCIDSAYNRRQACTETACFGYARVYGQACLATAKPDSSLCNAVPGPDSLTNTIFWRVERCEARGTVDAACDATFGAVQEYCASNIANR